MMSRPRSLGRRIVTHWSEFSYASRNAAGLRRSCLPSAATARHKTCRCTSPPLHRFAASTIHERVSDAARFEPAFLPAQGTLHNSACSVAIVMPDGGKNAYCENQNYAGYRCRKDNFTHSRGTGAVESGSRWPGDSYAAWGFA